MQAPPKPPDEEKRLRSLQALQVLDTPPEERFDRVTRLARRTFGVPIALVSLVDEGRQWFKSRQGLDATETSREISFCGHAILGDEIFEVRNALEDGRFADNPLVTDAPHIRFYAGAPLRAPDGSKVGTLCLIDREPRALDTDDRELLVDLARMVEDDLANRALATTDELTGLSNRRGFSELAERALAMCRRIERPAALLYLDLDGFKAINDEHGHEEGDHVLRAVAEVLREAFRESDVIGRIGGDEFCVLLADAAETKAPVERLRRDLAEWVARRAYALDVSVGIAECAPEHDTSLADLMRVADERMYGQKRRCSSDGGVASPSRSERS